MSNEVDAVAGDVVAVMSTWGPETSLETVRSDWDGMFRKGAPGGIYSVEDISLAARPALLITPPGAGEVGRILYLHGGGYVFGSPTSHRHLAARLALASRAGVVVLDYRLAPENPFPAALDDAVGAYEQLLEQGVLPSSIAVVGDSAGAGLALALLLTLKERKLPMPSSAALLSPWTDLALTGPSLISRGADDPIIQKDGLASLVGLYAGGKDVRDPFISPLYADLSELPPLIVHVGAREALHDDAERLVEAARDVNVPVEFKVWDGQIHVFQLFADRLESGEQSLGDIGRFIQSHLKGG